jgi:NADH-quinone oxidoreductase subunit L
MFRLVYGIFMGSYRGRGPARHGHDDEEESEAGSHVSLPRGIQDIHEVPAIMTWPLIILAVLSVIGGFVGSFGLIGISRWHPLSAFLSPVFQGILVPEASLGIQWISTLLSVGLGLVGIFVAWRMYGQGFQYKENPNPLYQLVFHKYYVDEILIAVLINPLLWLGRIATQVLEGNALDGGSRGVAIVLKGTSAALRRLQTGYMRNYALAILFGVVLIILYYAVRG